MSRLAFCSRIGLLVLIAGIAFALRAIDPTTLPLATSCGAVTGLPCIFCGTTRALHHLLNGNFARALYFNWLAFPFALVVVAACARLAAELILRREIRLNLPKPKLAARNVAAAAACIFVLWIFQASLAVGLHKQELLNPRGLLYHTFVR